jgi:hypothetical protein
METKIDKNIKVEDVSAWLTPREVCSLLRLSNGGLGNWRRRNLGPAFFRLGGKILYRRVDVEAFLVDHYQRGYAEIPSGEKLLPES